MRTWIGRTSLCCMAFAPLLGILPPAATAREGLHREVSIAGEYVVTIEVLPPTPPDAPNAGLVWDGGAQLLGLGGSHPPNHRLAVFVTAYGRPVDRADVMILYRTIGMRPSSWVSLPVARMHTPGKGLDTTEYGNNVRLPPDAYQVRVGVNREGAATFGFRLHS